ncbi:hypothetical protein ATCC90586_001505 [Pythium insidiosum]|nr:hypothetical protein ATCC90586_001505 [Pythium insidiosum]
MAMIRRPSVSIPTLGARRSLSTEHPPDKHLGAHISAAGGCVNALRNALALGPHATAFSFFIRPRLSWRPVPPIALDMERAFHAMLTRDAAFSRFRHDKIVVHGSYILNFGSHDAELREKSVQLMIEEVSKCQQLGVRWYVFHPGSCTRVPAALQWETPRRRKPMDSAERREQDEKQAAARAMSIGFIAECMNHVLQETKDADVALVLENMCGQGNVLGRDFGELRAMLDATKAGGAATERLGVCLDTCHAWSSGMQMSTAEECDAMMRHFGDAMGDEWQRVLKVVHVNDSMDACGSKRDRHDNIGFGRIGLTAFEWLMNDPRFDGLPLILETPRRGLPRQDQIQGIGDPRHRELLAAVQDSDASEIELLHRLHQRN